MKSQYVEFVGVRTNVLLYDGVEEVRKNSQELLAGVRECMKTVAGRRYFQ